MRSLACLAGLAIFAVIHDARGELCEGAPCRAVLTKAQIQGVLNAQHAAYGRCYKDNAPELQVRLSVRIVIEPSGRVSSAYDDGSERPHQAVLACIVGVLQKVTFPRSDVQTHVRVPFEFPRVT